MTFADARHSGRSRIHIGFVPLLDAAPLIVAYEFGFFEKYDLDVRLHREPGWASVRDKIVYGELDAAHAVAGLAFAINYGLGTLRQACVSGLLLNSHGDAITLSRQLLDEGIRDANDVAVAARVARRERPMTFGVVHAFSSHHFLLQTWLRQAHVIPGRDVQIVVVPPPLMAPALEAGHLDGFCVGDPYNSLAQREGYGEVVATSAGICQGHPEKALIARRQFATEREDEHLRLIAAVYEACAFCDQPENREEIATLISAARYVGLDRELLMEGFSGSLGGGEDFVIFHRYDVNRPNGEKADWILGSMRMCGLLADVDLRSLPKTTEVLREDIFEKAMRLTDSDSNAANAGMAGAAASKTIPPSQPKTRSRHSS